MPSIAAPVTKIINYILHYLLSVIMSESLNTKCKIYTLYSALKHSHDGMNSVHGMYTSFNQHTYSSMYIDL